MIHTFGTMGTVATIRTPWADLSQAILRDVEQIFNRYDATFSLYDPNSVLSRVARGELRLTETSSEVRDTYARALKWRSDTGGAFTANRPDGVVDLSGVVKALAMQDAGRVLDRSHGSWLLVVGGDVLARGDNDGVPWRCGIVDPADRSALLGVLELTEEARAAATSGTAERGEHVWRTGTSSEFRQVTVRARDIITADVLATAVLAGSRATLDHTTERWPVDVLTASRTGELLATPRARGWIPVTAL